MQNIIPIKKLTEFYFRSSLLGGEIGKVEIMTEVKFPPRAQQQIIQIKDEAKTINFILTYYGEETKHFEFNEIFFSKEELNILSLAFNFITIAHPYAPNFIVGSIPNKNDTYRGQCLGAISRTENNYYLLIFARRGSTAFEDDIIYVHGIWKVELEASFKNKFWKSEE